ncbi:MAG TPA: methionine--tRNA ligase [Candidatus Faeciplasma gallinarum]|uniref:Methionine--tRNA ligase n=1 Tax=Candidatus Faeciplasma gallinarum TaxID=2840799 RepID=A0A9D1EMC2_9FIRM|nr:methionine--tRNA ligase [Candidatus Faeciplasma gallinarum]
MDKKPCLITTAIAYTSKKPHIGNTYDVVCADALARFKRMQGYDVFFLTGTDEHGQKIEEQATAAGITPKEHVDMIAGEVKRTCDMLGVSYSRFIRTTDPDHERCVQKIFDKLYKQRDIYKSEYEGWYCVPCESFYTETQLVDGKCPDCGREVVKTKEEAYFLRLSKYQSQLEKFLEDNPDFIQPESRKKEMINNFIKPGLQDLCITRSSFKWGIPVDFDPKHVIYVWIDALSNYISGLGYDVDNPSEMYKYYWQNCTHIIGKDILRFHSIYWIVELMALGAMLPKKIFAHPWLLFGTDKMSKSKGNVIYADDLVTRFGVDATRYYMLSEMPFAADGSISYEAVIERYNTDLANTIGNLVNRTVAMVNKYFGGYVDAPHDKTELDLELEAKALEAAKNLSAHFEAFRFADACADVLALARRANKYIDETEPWALAKTEEGKSRLVTVLYELIETIRFIGIMIRPIMPETSEKILAQINTDLDGLDTLCAFGGYAAGTKVGEAVPLFARIDSKKIMDELKAEMDAVKAKIEEENAKGGEPKAEVKPLADEIAIDEFAKVELRAAKVLECEKLEKSQKLLKLKLDDGMGTRQVVSGIAKWYKPEDLIGKTVVVVANLKPAKLCGEESQGMIVCAEMPDGSAKVAFLDGSVPPGAKLR